MPKPKLERHPLSMIFPEMRAEDYGNLRKSIRENGFYPNKQIVLLDDMVLDGWNRYKAALDNGIKEIDIPKRIFKGGDPIEFVMSENLARRHLTSAQATAAAVNLAEAWKKAEKEQDEKDKAAAKKKGEKEKKTKAKGDKIAAAAKAMGVSARNVAAAAKVKKKDPKKFEDIEKGKISVNEAHKEVQKVLSAEEKASAAFSEACAHIDKVLGENFSKTATQKLTSKEVLKMSGLEADEMKRIKPFIESGWKLTQALSYKVSQLSFGHNIRQLCDRATANGGNFAIDIGDFHVEVSTIIKK